MVVGWGCWVIRVDAYDRVDTSFGQQICWGIYAECDHPQCKARDQWYTCRGITDRPGLESLQRQYLLDEVCDSTGWIVTGGGDDQVAYCPQCAAGKCLVDLVDWAVGVLDGPGNSLGEQAIAHRLGKEVERYRGRFEVG